MKISKTTHPPKFNLLEVMTEGNDGKRIREVEITKKIIEAPLLGEFHALEKAVVAVHWEDEKELKGRCGGTVVSPDGLFLTVCHGFEVGAKNVYAYFRPDTLSNYSGDFSEKVKLPLKKLFTHEPYDYAVFKLPKEYSPYHYLPVSLEIPEIEIDSYSIGYDFSNGKNRKLLTLGEVLIGEYNEEGSKYNLWTRGNYFRYFLNHYLFSLRVKIDSILSKIDFDAITSNPTYGGMCGSPMIIDGKCYGIHHKSINYTGGQKRYQRNVFGIKPARLYADELSTYATNRMIFPVLEHFARFDPLNIIDSGKVVGKIEEALKKD